MDYKIFDDEVVLYEGVVGYQKSILNTKFILTSKKMIFEREKGLFKKTKEVIDIIPLSEIKIFNDEVQVKQKFNEIQVQTFSKNFSVYFAGMLEAKKVNSKIISVISGTSAMQRGSDRVKSTLNMIDETLGLNSREIVKGVVENGIRNTLINGIKKDNKKIK